MINNNQENLIRELMTHEPRIRAFFSRQKISEHDVDDLTQETLIAAWKGLANFNFNSSIYTWMYGIAKHVLMHYFKSNSREPILLKVDAECAESPCKENELFFKLILEELSYSEISLYNNFYRDRMTIKEISRSSGEKEGTIKYKLFLLREKLKSKL